MIGNVNYDGKKIHKSLSITPINDIKDMLNLLEKTEVYGLQNTYEDVPTKENLNDIFEGYIESLNKYYGFKYQYFVMRISFKFLFHVDVILL